MFSKLPIVHVPPFQRIFTSSVEMIMNECEIFITRRVNQTDFPRALFTVFRARPTNYHPSTSGQDKTRRPGSNHFSY